MLKAIVSTLVAAAIITSAMAIVRVNVLENNFEWIKEALVKIEVKLDQKCGY